MSILATAWLLAPNLGIFPFGWLYAKIRDSGSIFAFDAVLNAYLLTFSGSIGCSSCSLPLSGFPCTTLPDMLDGFMVCILGTGRAGKGREGK